MPMRVLVTGGSGFIGTHLVQCLLDAGTPVVNLSLRAPLASTQRDVYCPGDVTDFRTVQDVFGSFNPTAVVHLAARTEASYSRDYTTNTKGTQVLLQTLRSSTNTKIALFASSMVVAWPRRENVTQYAKSKARMEQVIAAAAPMRCAVSVVRPVSTWGPHFGTPFKQFFEAIARGRYWHPGPATAPKRFAYVGNIAYQLRRLLHRGPEEINGKTLFLGDYEPFTLASWASLIARAFGVMPPRVLPGWLVGAAAKAGDALQSAGMANAPLTSRRLENMRTDTSVFPIEEIQSMVGPLPYTVENGVDETVRWLKSTQEKRSQP